MRYPAFFWAALGADMTAMEEYFPFITAAFDIMQYTAWAVLFLITVWQLFRVFGGPITEAENPWQLVARQRHLCAAHRVCKADLHDHAGHRPRTLHSPDGLDLTAEDFTFAGR